MILLALFASGGENVNFLTQMRTKCVLKYQKSTHCVPNVNFADLFGSTGDCQNRTNDYETLASGETGCSG